MGNWIKDLRGIAQELERQEEIKKLADGLLIDGTIMRLVPLLKFPGDVPDEFYQSEWRYGPPHKVVVHNNGVPVFAYYNGNTPVKGDVIGVRVHSYRRKERGKTYGVGEVIHII